MLKIDQSFVQGVSSSSEDAAITCATIAMARQLGLRVVAEGVEEQDQMDFLLALRVQRIPGLPVLAGRARRRLRRMLRTGIANVHAPSSMRERNNEERP